MATVAVARTLRRKSLGDAPTGLPIPDVTQSMPLTRLRAPSKSAVRSPSHTRSPSNSTAASSRRPSKSGFSRQTSPAEDAPIPLADAVTKQTSLPSLPDVKTPALVLSRQLNLDFHEVKMMLSAWQNEHQKFGCAGMDLATFKEALLRVLGISEVTSDLLQEAYIRCEAADGPVNPRSFLTWFRDHVFALSQLPSIGDKKADDLTLELAKKHRCSCIDLDKVKMQYDSYDLDKSGVIEYGEFEMMMLKLLHVSEKSDLPSNRIQRFWQELDRDQNGTVDFSEFAEWYLKYFNLAQEHGPIEAFYASFGPGFQRASTLEAMCKTKSDGSSHAVPPAVAAPKRKELKELKEEPKAEMSMKSASLSTFHRRMTIG